MDRFRASITDFLTDGSLIALCDALGQLTRARVTLHDTDGRRIVRADSESHWAYSENDGHAETLAAHLSSPDRRSRTLPETGWLLQPLEVAGQVIGGIVIDADPLRTPGADIERLRDIVAHLASAVDELCEQDVELAQRNTELSVLYRLSSLLVAARDLDTVLRVALRSAMDILGADAAAIHLVDEDATTFRLRAHMGISDGFASRFLAPPPPDAPPGPPDLDRFVHPDDEEVLTLARADGFEGVIRGDLSFRGRRQGSMHLFTRRSTLLEPEERALLQTINEQISAAVASANLLESERRARGVQRQLRLAADVQRRMLPSSLPTVEPLDLGARYIPSFDLGGDFYDFMELSGNLGFFVGDVAGKGVPAALLMASVRSALRAHASERYHLDEVLARVNDHLVRDTLPNEFATVFYGVIDPRTLRLTYCSAGHDPTLLLRPPAGRAPTEADLHALDTGGMVIGVSPNLRYERGMFDLAPGDTIVAYTDGMIDARDFSGKRFGRDRLRAAIVGFLGANPDAPAQAVADHLLWEVRRFVGLNPATDDETVLVIRVKRR